MRLKEQPRKWRSKCRMENLGFDDIQRQEA